MTVAVCDDEKFFINSLLELIDNYSKKRAYDIDVFSFSGGGDLLASDIKFDLIFLDYQMAFINGIETAKKIRGRKNDTKIIFVSSHPDVVFESMKYNVYRFLVKPVEPAAFDEAMDSIRNDIQTRHYLVVTDKTNDRKITVPQQDIIYIQADNVYSIVNTSNESYMYMHNLSAISKELSPMMFYRTNRSYIVNLRHIKSYNKTEIELSNGHKAIISKLKFNDFQSRYFAYLRELKEQS